jgi:hypothetical protein
MNALESSARISSLQLINNEMIIHLKTGEKIITNINNYPKLMRASADARNNWRIMGGGLFIEWEAADEVLLIDELFENPSATWSV